MPLLAQTRKHEALGDFSDRQIRNRNDRRDGQLGGKRDNFA